ncbi:hypothetical protein NP233_g5812 [Leucocoprinus birnbaumii]|uniref:Uncharacterized protein n=1 Tax=Leucocoprinus birnbaumii TaxID=56174 RepID=A0AAD5YQK9_9AGAR|nr:hypothetical protein NP233_g5812 [Leucocoprinus birnbaumii]
MVDPQESDISQEPMTSSARSSTLVLGDGGSSIGPASPGDLSVEEPTSTLVLPNEIYPSSPTYTLRYQHDRKREDKDPFYQIQPRRITFKDEQLPVNWNRQIHPEGLPFFYQLPSTNCPMRVFTDEWLYDKETADHITNFLNEIIRAIRDYDIIIYPNSDLVLELQLDRGTWKCGYYFVYHPTKAIYWLEEVNLEYLSKQVDKEIRGEISHGQAETCMEVEYWVYWDCFPNLQEITPDIYDYAMSTIRDAMTDVVSSKSDSTITASYDDLKRMLKITKKSKGCNSSKWHIGRFLRRIIGDRLRNYYGAYGARISRKQQIIKTQIPAEGRSKFFWVFSPILFFIPHAQLERVEPLLIDNHVIVLYWDKFFKELQEEWNQTMMLATILLAANCAFLAIPLFQASDDSPRDLGGHSTPAQIASYFSLVAGLYGFILSMIMYRQQKVRSPDTPGEIIDYVYNDTKSGPRHRLQHLVLIWSLPHALVTWSVLTFLMAFLLMCFTGTLTSTKVLMAVSTALLSSLVLYYIFRFSSAKKMRALWTKRTKHVVLEIRRKFRLRHEEKIQPGSDSSSTVNSVVIGSEMEICINPSHCNDT